MRTSYGCNENCIEWLRDESRATLSLSQRRVISKIERLAKSNSEECVITAHNEDGSICAHVPVSWIKISPPRTVTEEQREKARQNMNLYHTNNGTIPCEND